MKRNYRFLIQFDTLYNALHSGGQGDLVAATALLHAVAAVEILLESHFCPALMRSLRLTSAGEVKRSNLASDNS